MRNPRDWRYRGAMSRVRGALSTYGDLLLAAALAVLGECELLYRPLDADFHGPRALNAALIVVIALPVVWRRRAPLAAFAIYGVAGSAWLAAVYGPHANLPLEPFLVLLILIYSAATYVAPGKDLAVLAVLGVVVLSEVVLFLVGRKSVGNAVPGLLFMAFAYSVGRGLRRKQVQTAALERRAVEADAEAGRLAIAAVAEERDRIARELHDVIAHAVSVMVVQAGGGQRLLATDGAAAGEAFETIRRTGAEALDELRRLLGLLREPRTGDGGTAPQPRLSRLDGLLDDARSAGLAVRCTVHGGPRRVPDGVDLAAYRIVQEALTNVRRHAGGAAATVTIEYLPRELLVTVEDDGPPAPHPNRANGGHGLVGMRERVAIYGGTLEAAPRAGGGFLVRARMPLPAEPA